MTEKLPEYKKQLEELDAKLASEAVLSDMKQYKALMQERSHLAPVIEKMEEIIKLEEEIEGSKEMIKSESDQELVEMAKEEIAELEEKHAKAEKECRMLLIPPDPLEGKNIIMEIRAGTGGDEASLFAQDVFRMYSRYAEKKHWKETESGGRIHTSAVTVAVLPEAEETDIEIKQEDLRIDVMRAGGPGGQCVNTTDSAVRITHIPSGIVVICQDEKSQIKNRAKAMRVLRSRLYEAEESRKRQERADARKNMVGSGDRSERIRTYNFPQNRLTDHRINLTLYKLDLIMEGELGEVIDALKLAAGEKALEEA